MLVATRPVDFRKGMNGLAAVVQSAAQLSALIEGLDWTRVHATPLARPQVAQ